MAMLSRFSTHARRRAGRQRAIATAAITGPSAVDLAEAVIELIPNSGWRARVNCCTLGWGFPDRQTAEEYLAGLVEQQRRSKENPDGR